MSKRLQQLVWEIFPGYYKPRVLYNFDTEEGKKKVVIKIDLDGKKKSFRIDISSTAEEIEKFLREKKNEFDKQPKLL